RRIATLKPLAPELVEHLPLRRVLEALLDASRTSTPVADHPLWHDPNRRQALYRWIDAHSATIADDRQLSGPLAGACIIPTRAGVMQAPRHLLMEGSPLEELASSQPADEVPTTLRQTLGQLYALDGDQTRRLVELLADAHRAAQSQEDGSRSAAILEAMAQALDPKRVEADLRQDLLQRHKVARLRIELHGGAFEQIRRVMAPGAEHQQLLSSFLTQRPPTAHPRYGAPAIRALLVAVGASPALSEEHLRQLLAAPDTHLHPSTSAAVALAHYIARLLEEEPGLLSALSLDQTAWIPNGDGHLCRPSDLYWPTPDLESILGQPTARLPHPAWVDLVSSDVRRRLPLLTLERAALADVIAHIGAQGQPFTMTPAVLEWFEASLRGGHLDPKAVQDALSDLLLFDDYGTLRHSSQLLCTPAEHLFGHRRGTWSAGLRYSKFAATLHIPQRAGPDDIFAVGETIATELEQEGSSPLLQRDPDLRHQLTACLGHLATDEASPNRRMPLVAEDASGRLQLVIVAHPSLVLLQPDDRLGPEDPSELLTPVLPSVQEPALRWLHASGVRWLRQPSPDEHAPEAHHPEPSKRPPTPKTPATQPEKSWWSRARAWWQGDNDPTPDETARDRPSPTPRPSRRPPPDLPMRRPTNQRRWFQDSTALESQLHDATGWLEERTLTPEFGFGFAPARLPFPWQYGPQAVLGRFDRGTQRWLAVSLDPSWLTAAAPGSSLVAIRGQMPRGRVRLPLPMYARVLELHTSQGPLTIHSARMGVMVHLTEDSLVEGVLQLDEAPRFLGEEPVRGVPSDLLNQTCPDRDLPDEALDMVDALRQGDRSELDRALQIRDFIRDRYRYDPTYLEDPAVARWLRNLSRGSAHAHLTALHAGRDSQYLGRGVCYELNALACELMRRVGVPSAVATGWTWDEGSISEPDHLWAAIAGGGGIDGKPSGPLRALE
ncbi:MAG: transglutaminase-like domain-containing protein, partial [Myxococcota bacterium]